MNCHGKNRFRTRAAASRKAERDFKRHGGRLYPYPCTCGGFHLTKTSPTEFLANANDRMLRDMARAEGQDITREERRLLERELRKIAELVEKDRLWLEAEAERTRLEAERILDLAENLRLARNMEEEKTR